MRRSERGITLTELLIVGAIIAVLVILLLLGGSKHVTTARDAQRKTDLEKIRVAFEDYYNDHGCYPDSTALEACGTADLFPYLREVPCDPITNQPYYYEPDATDQCSGYRVLTQLQSPDVTTELIGESCPTPGYNYGISDNLSLSPDGCSWVTVAPGVTPTPPVSPSTSPYPSGSPGPSPSASPVDIYACDPDGVCNLYHDPIAAGCPVTFGQDETCQNECYLMSNRCDQ